MPSMSPRKAAPTKIAMPPRLSFCLSELSDGSDSAPCTPSPHTPLPYETGFPPDLAAQHAENCMNLDEQDTFSTIGSKRVREEETVPKGSVWTEEEMDTLSSTLLHPFRPLSTPYPPGDLPPPNIIDELTNQILAYAFRNSPTKRDIQSGDDGWTHTWEETRKRLFHLALAESKGQEASKGVTRQDRVARPGLKRMDSMDFLDENVQERPSDSMGRAIQLSTSLQNSAKNELVAMGMSRSSSENSLGTSKGGSDGASDATTIVASPTSIILSPSPSQSSSSQSVKPIPPPQSTSRPPILQRHSSFRKSTLQRPSSLLQRGRSFTASDLAAEAETDGSEEKSQPAVPEAITEVLSEPSDSPPGKSRNTPKDDPPPSAQPKTKQRPNLSLHGLIPPNPLSQLGGAEPKLALPSSITQKPKFTRSVSSSAVLHPPHTSRDTFLALHPSSTDRSSLAQPLPVMPDETQSSGSQTLGKPCLLVEGGSDKGGSSEWSDSDDEGPVKTRAVKKIRGGRLTAQALKVQTFGLGVNGADGALRSPFEEKIELGV